MKKIIEKNNENKILLFNVIGAFLIKGFSLIVSIFSMPLYIKYFKNNTVLGVWYTILSLLSWILVCDLGLGNGLRNKLTEAMTLKDEINAKRYISSSYISLGLIIIPITFIGCIIIKNINCNKILNIPISYISQDTLQISLIILLIGISLSFILKLINSIIYAMQLSTLNNLITLISSILPLIYILFFNGIDNNKNFISLSIVHVFSINMPLIAATIICFKSDYMKKCKPSYCYFDKNISKSLLKFGLKFFSAQIFFMFLMATNEIIITRIYGPEKVVEYSVYYKVFMVFGSLFTLALTPLWSKITKDFTKKNYLVIHKTGKILYALASIGVLFEFSVIPFLQTLVDFWLGDNTIKVSLSNAYLFAIFGGVFIFNIVVTTVANGLGELKTQIFFYGIGAVLKIPIILLFSNIGNSWRIIVIYNIIVLMLFCLYQVLWFENKIKKLLLNGGNKNV